MAVFRRTRRDIKGLIWIPPAYKTQYKLEVTRSNGVVDDITDECWNIEIEDGITDVIGNFKFEIYNPRGIYTNIWSGMDIIKYYSDYSPSATSPRFVGRVEKVSYNNNKITVTGRSESIFFLRETITSSYEDTEISDILKNIVNIVNERILNRFGISFTTNNVTATGITHTVSWLDTPFWEAVQDLARKAKFDVYIDYDRDFHLFESGSKLNTTDGVMEDYNLLSLPDFANDLTTVRNFVRVTGATIDGVQVVATASDLVSQGKYGISKKIINDTNIITETQAQEVADSWLESLKDPSIVSECSSVLLATIQPGDKIYVASPSNNLSARKYQVQKYKHSISNNNFRTTLALEKETRKITHFLKSMVDTDTNLKDSSTNPSDMDYSFNFYFNDSTGSFTNTEYLNSFLKLVDGQANGSWLSSTRTLSSNLKSVFLRLVGQSLNGASVEVSADGGLTYQQVDLNKFTNVTATEGKTLLIRVTLNNTATQIDSLSLLYNLV